MFETIFLNAVQAISDSRFWLGPILLICIYVLVALEVFEIVQEEIEELEVGDQKSEIRSRRSEAGDWRE